MPATLSASIALPTVTRCSGAWCWRGSSSNEFSVLEPLPGYTTTETFAVIAVDALDPTTETFAVIAVDVLDPTTERLAVIAVDALAPTTHAKFWAYTAGWLIGSDLTGVIVGLRAPGGHGPWSGFLHPTQPKVRTNRLRPMVHGGAYRAAVDTEGNEFSLVERL